MVCHGDYTEAKILNQEPLQDCWYLEGQNHSIPPGNGQSKRLNNSALLGVLEGGQEGQLRSCLRHWFTPAGNGQSTVPLGTRHTCITSCYYSVRPLATQLRLPPFAIERAPCVFYVFVSFNET